nr:MAG TPA: hypothetical protein [Caudoviricetes sp.]
MRLQVSNPEYTLFSISFLKTRLYNLVCIY